MNPLMIKTDVLMESIDAKLRLGLRALAGMLIASGYLLYLHAAKVVF